MKGSPNQPGSTWLLIALLAAAKLAIHLITYNNYGLHRDAYLYFALGEHLQWGYVAVPPSIAAFSAAFTGILGNSVFALRVIPALVGAGCVLVIGAMVKELKGGWPAILLAGLAYILGPAYLHVNTLFQPVSFNHLYWLLSAWLILKMINRSDPKYWPWIAVVLGLAFLNKYSIVFFAAAFGISLLLTSYRRLLLSKYFLMAVGLGIIIILPNLIWQYNHNWPVLIHMAELRSTQLVHVQPSGFLADQLLMNGHALLLWLPTLGFLLFSARQKQYRIFGLIFVFVILLQLLGSGKSYYTLGIYPVLFVFGAVFICEYLRGRYLAGMVTLQVALMIAGFVFSLHLDGIPFMKTEKLVNEKAYRWEDGKYYDLPQDLADMRGWDVLAGEVIGVYQSLPAEVQNETTIFCENYGQAGSVLFYGKEHDLPEPVCFTGTFAMWAPDTISSKNIIAVLYESVRNANADSVLNQWFGEVNLKSVVQVPYFRENGTRIYLLKDPGRGFHDFYQSEIHERNALYGINKN